MRRTVGVIVNNISDPFFTTLLAALDDALAESGRTVLLCNTGESVTRQAKSIRKLAAHGTDGIVISPAIGSSARDFLPLRGHTLPFVFVSRTVSELDCDHVVNDDYKATVLPVNRLLSMGHRRIALVGGHPSLSGFQERLRGYRAALERAEVGFDASLVMPCVPTRAEGFRAAGQVALLSPRPTAAVGYNDAVALGLSAGLRRQGLVPGRDFALIGHEDVEEAGIADPPLSVTTVRRGEMGRRAATALLERMERPEAPPKRVVLDTELIVRESCKFAPASHG